jgi:hypothetical protein
MRIEGISMATSARVQTGCIGIENICRDTDRSGGGDINTIWVSSPLGIVSKAEARTFARTHGITIRRDASSMYLRSSVQAWSRPTATCARSVRPTRTCAIGDKHQRRRNILYFDVPNSMLDATARDAHHKGKSLLVRGRKGSAG